MNLVINNKLINEPIENILRQIKLEIHGKYLREIGKPKRGNITITCPFHKDGNEAHPSCQVFCGESDKTEYGFYKCFTCGEQGPLYKLVGKCFDKDDEFGKEWLLERYGYNFVKSEVYLPEIQLESGEVENKDSSILEGFQSWHPYLTKRKLSKNVCKQFGVCFDPKTECVVFPVKDEYDNLVFLTRRSVNSKKFIIDKDADKPVYLLNEIRKRHIDEVIVCESQINALYCWSLGYPAVALFGTGSKEQYKILNRMPIRHYYLAFDGDEAGKKGTVRFINNIRKDVFVDVMCLPSGKDINDLSPQEFESLEIIESISWLSSFYK